MSNSDIVFSSLAKAGGAIGKGIIAGFAGTVAITLSQIIEMKITKRGNSNAPVEVGGKALGVEPRGKAAVEKEKAESEQDRASEAAQEKEEKNEEKFAQIMHFSYGTGWGVARGALDLAGVHGLAASLVHFGAVWGTALVMLPATGQAKPVTEWPLKQIAIDKIHHMVYALAAGAVYDAMTNAEKRKKKKWKIW